MEIIGCWLLVVGIMSNGATADIDPSPKVERTMNTTTTTVVVVVEWINSGLAVRKQGGSAASPRPISGCGFLPRSRV